MTEVLSATAEPTTDVDTTCGTCGRVMATKATLSRHVARMHPADAVADIPVQRAPETPPMPAAAPPVPSMSPSDSGAYQVWTGAIAPVSATSRKPLWKKKRFLIPVSLLALFVIIGIASPSPEKKPAASSTPTVQSAPVLTEAQKAEAARQAAAKAAADKVAAAKAAAAKAAADKAAAKAAAAKAAAERAAAAKAAAEKAARERPVALSSRTFSLLVKNPDDYVGRHFIIYGEVTQFDSATGTGDFLADSGANKDPISYGYTDYSDNTLYEGDPSLLANVVEGDVFRATVEVLGSESYDTQIGGNTTVPKFKVQTISVYGSTK